MHLLHPHSICTRFKTEHPFKYFSTFFPYTVFFTGEVASAHLTQPDEHVYHSELKKVQALWQCWDGNGKSYPCFSKAMLAADRGVQNLLFLVWEALRIPSCWYLLLVNGINTALVNCQTMVLFSTETDLQSYDSYENLKCMCVSCHGGGRTILKNVILVTFSWQLKLNRVEKKYLCHTYCFCITETRNYLYYN